MVWRSIVLTVGLAAWPLAALGEDAALGDFFGHWKGVEAELVGNASIEIEPSDLDQSIEASGVGFKVQGFAMGRSPNSGQLVRRPFEASFAPTELPGVFAFDPSAGQSLLSSLFADPKTGNPLEGDTLLWSRLDDGALHIYSLSIDDDGRFNLDHSIERVSGDTMELHYDVRFENDRVERVTGRLERAGD